MLGVDGGGGRADGHSGSDRHSGLADDAHSHSHSHSHPVLVALRLYATQLWCLCVKSGLVLRRSKKALATFLLAPLLLVALMWIIQSRIDSAAKGDSRGVDVQLRYQPCKTIDIYGNEDPSVPCVSLYYSPANDSNVHTVMGRAAARLGLRLGTDVVGVSDVQTLMWTLAAKVGRYDAAVSFDQLPPWCTSPPCDTMSADEVAEAKAAHAARSASADAPAERRMAGGDMSSCPITTPLNVEYVLWYNETTNPNDNVPGFVTQVQQSYDSVNNQPVPPRYWAIQQAMNLAITDAISAPGVPDAGNGGEMADPEHVHVDDAHAFAAAADPAAATGLHVALFSMYAGRTGSASDWQNNNDNGFNLDNYVNDSVAKYAGSSILTIGVLVMTLLAMQLVAAEKQGRIIGILRIMGMKESAYWTSWLTVFTAMAITAALLATGMGKIRSASDEAQ